MVTGARAEHQCTYMTSLPVYSIACSSEQDRALILAHLASCGGEQLQKTLWRPERCVGSVTLGMSPRIQQSPELQEKYVLCGVQDRGGGCISHHPPTHTHQVLFQPVDAVHVAEL